MTAPRTRPIADRAAYRACLAGDQPAETLQQRQREQLIVQLHARGWTDIEIAAHTRMSTYTVGRICDRLHLTPQPRKDIA